MADPSVNREQNRQRVLIAEVAVRKRLLLAILPYLHRVGTAMAAEHLSRIRAKNVEAEDDVLVYQITFEIRL